MADRIKPSAGASVFPVSPVEYPTDNGLGSVHIHILTAHISLCSLASPRDGELHVAAHVASALARCAGLHAPGVAPGALLGAPAVAPGALLVTDPCTGARAAVTVLLPATS